MPKNPFSTTSSSYRRAIRQPHPKPQKQFYKKREPVSHVKTKPQPSKISEVESRQKRELKSRALRIFFGSERRVQEAKEFVRKKYNLSNETKELGKVVELFGDRMR